MISPLYAAQREDLVAGMAYARRLFRQKGQKLRARQLLRKATEPSVRAPESGRDLCS